MVNLRHLAVAATALVSSVLAVPMVAAKGRLIASSRESTPIEGKYLIALKPGLKRRDLDTHLDWVDGVHKRGLSALQFNGVEKTYSGSYNFHGYAGHFDEATIAAIRKNPDVAMVEPDREWELDFIQEAPHLQPRTIQDARTTMLEKRTLTTQRNSTWGLGAISHRQQGSSDYIYNANAGKGTYAYVVDSGVLVSHKEFEGRAEAAYSAFENETAAESGVVSVIAAGNSGEDASDVSPASAPSAITVGAISANWTLADYTNFGPVVDIFAPGSRVTSAWIRNDTDSNTISGTSMATPHIVGLALTAISVDDVTGVADITRHLKETATKDKIIGDLKNSPNLVGNNNAQEE